MRESLLRVFATGLRLTVTMLAVAVPAAAWAAPAPKLPQNHEYQKTLYGFMKTLTAQDMTHGVPGVMEVKPAPQDPDSLYRNYIYSLMHMPMVGSKRGACSVTSAPECFTIPFIEKPDGVYLPPAWPECLMSMVQWDYPGNPFKDNRALKLRSFAAAATNMMMLHDFAERNDAKVPPPLRPDWHGANPMWWAFPYPGFKDVLPTEVQKAYETGLKMVGERILAWPHKGESCESNYNSTVGLLCIARAIDDADFSRKVEEYGKKFFTDPKFFNPAGYWVERGGVETGFGGTANFFASWAALMSDWPFAKESLARVYRLRGHLILPEPDGSATGPSHFNAKLGSPANLDQWPWNDQTRGSARDFAASLVTDEAAYAVPSLSPAQLASGAEARVGVFNSHLTENTRIDGHYLTNAEMLEQKLMGMKWVPRLWMSFDFPASVNPGYEHYVTNARPHRESLEKANSPLLKLPVDRGENFVRAFEKDFVVTRQPGYAAILHSGPVGVQESDDDMFQFAGPLGLGGGQLSAFWTPATGSVILGLRTGVSYGKSFDELDNWRNWPHHSVTGVTAAGKVFTSARNARPEVSVAVEGDASTVATRGPLMVMSVVKDPAAEDPAKAADQQYDAPLDGRLEYVRTLKTDATGVSVETVLTGDGKDTIAELYETLPIFMGRGTAADKPAVPTEIAFQVGGDWKPATDAPMDQVQKIKLTRFDGALLVTLDQPRRVKLSPAQWTDGWVNSGAAARVILIDRLENGDKPGTISGERKLAYRIEPTAK